MRININDIIKRPEYSFLYSDEHLKDKLMFVTLGGSHAYGTNVEGSDIDIRGIALNSESDLLGLTNFEQKLDNTTDTLVYSFNKVITLFCNCNPNVVEILGCRPEDYAEISNLGQMLLDNSSMFLSKRCVKSFGGYANAQLTRLLNALARETPSQSKREAHILESMTNTMANFNSRYKHFKDNEFYLHIEESDDPELDYEIVLDTTLTNFPIREFTGIISDISNVAKQYGKAGHRNTKKDDLHLNKHAMHLIRLYLMCCDILEKEKINTYRENDLDLLLSIRNGEYRQADGEFSKEFYELLDSLKDRMNYAIQNTSLPEIPDQDTINDFVMLVNKNSINFF